MANKKQRNWAGGVQPVADKPSCVLWKPHRTIHTRAVCCKKHFSVNSGLQIKVGYVINFVTREYRNRWLVAQYPRTYRRLA